ncbi:MAG: tubulin-like doman-containing protein [Rikenellaceae bacterium]
MTVLRRSLFIGVGGTGMNAILNTKKMFIDNYGGEVPPMIGFLGIDTDGGVYDKHLDSIYGKVVLDRSEQCSVSVGNPVDYYNLQRSEGNLDWLPAENSVMITTLDRGAGQVRTNGRLAFIYNSAAIEQAIQTAFARISDRDIIENDKYELMNTTNDEVHMVFSLCGGTGAGTFIDIAYLIQKIRRTVTVNGYAVLPNVFEEMQRSGIAMSRTKPNAYGALKDLDFLMSLTPMSKPIDFPWGYTSNSKPFSSINIIDNTNRNKVTYRHVDQLSDMISLALVSSTGQVGTETASIGDNTKVNIANGNLNIGGKVAWVTSLGTCEIIFSGEILARISAAKIALKLINLMTSNGGDANNIANNWIDSPEIQIRENQKQDKLIDSLLSAQPKYPSSGITNFDNPKMEVDSYITAVVPEDKKIQVGCDSKLKAVCASLEALIIETLNTTKEGGITLAQAVLKDIKSQVAIFKGEMSEELEAIQREDIPRLENILKVAYDDIKESQTKLFGKKKKAMAIVNDVVDIRATELAKSHLEVKRRIFAMQFYTALEIKIDEIATKIQNISDIINLVKDSIEKELTQTQNLIGKGKSAVRIDLAEGLATKIGTNDDNILVLEFIKNLDSESIYLISDAERLKAAFEAYTHNHIDVGTWREKSIDEVLNALSPEEFTFIAKNAQEIAEPLMKINDCGYTVPTPQGPKPIDTAIDKKYFVCVPDKTANRFSTGEEFKKMNKGDITYISTGLNDRVIIYRQEGTVPVFTIDSVAACKTTYEGSEHLFHFDALIHRRMKEEGFDINPAKNISPEKSEDAVALWVKGFIFGFITIKNNKYWYKDTSRLDAALDGYWIDTKEASRDLAFKEFCKVFKTLDPQYEKEIDDIIAQKGKKEITAMIDELKSGNTYYERFIPLNKETLKQRGYEGVADLVTRELNFVFHKLSE